MRTLKTTQCSTEEQLQNEIADYALDPLGFVKYAYPWGEKGTELEHEELAEWQIKILEDIQHALEHGWVMNEGIKKSTEAGIFIAVSSGHGIGKSALMAMIDHWFNSTHPHPQIVTTANTESQLKSKTWREMSKWKKLLINSHWFELTATKMACLVDPATWFSMAIPWSEKAPEGFAGTHAKYVLIKYDEASAIPDVIWETTEGAMTDTGGIKIWITFGNPTRPTGRFAECFGSQSHRWLTYRVDSRDVARTDKALFNEWARTYGEDSDFFRVRAKGEFPRQGFVQFIPTESVNNAAGKVVHPSAFMSMPKILAIDIARFGSDKTSFIRRQGTASYKLKKFRGLDSVRCAGLIAQEIQEYKPDVVFLDMGNTGAAIYDILTGWGYEITPVWFGAAADDDQQYLNKRTEMWARARDWLKNGGAIPDDRELKDDLINPEYSFSTKGQIQLESKKDMKKRGVDSPDCGDALAMTFAYEIEFKDGLRDHVNNTSKQARTTYNVLDGGASEREQAKAKVDYRMFS